MAGQEITKALVARHGAGRTDTYGAALLDIAQDHLLWLLSGRNWSIQFLRGVAP